MSGFIFDTIVADVVACIVVVAAWSVYYVRKKFSHWERKGVFFNPPSFPFGNFKDMFLQRTSMREMSQRMYAATDKPVIGMYVGISPTLLVRDPQMIRQILVSDFATFDDRGLYCDEKLDPLSGHLFSLAPEKWRPLRNKLSPTFTSGKLKAMFTTIVDCGAALDSHVARLAANNETVEMRELLAQYMTNVIASVAFGIDIDCIANPDTPFRHFGRQTVTPSKFNLMKLTIANAAPGFYKLTGLKLFDPELDQFFMSVVEKNMEMREHQNVTRKDFFQLLVQLRNTDAIQADDDWKTKITGNARDKKMSIAECAAQVFVFFLAGFETSSSTQSFCLYELARNPTLQKRAQQEVDEVLAKHNGELTYESASEMKYLGWCIDETLRKYPPLTILSRKAVTDWPLPNSPIGATIDRGTSIMIPLLALQNDPKYFPEPERFIPERFSPEQATEETAHLPYFPFGDGPRNCIGMRMGKMQTKVGLILLLSKYNFELAGVTRKPLVMNSAGVLLQPKGGINLSISKRADK